MIYFVIELWNGKEFGHKTVFPKATSIATKLGKEVRRFVLTEEQEILGIDVLLELEKQGKLNPALVNAGSTKLVPDCLKALGLYTIVSKEKLTKKFNELAKLHHPDVGGDEAVFIKIRKAYEAALLLVER